MTPARGVAIVGCGLIGQKRLKAIGPARLIATADVDLERAQRLAAMRPDALAFGDWRTAITLPEVEIVLVATLHDSLAEITAAAIAAGKHVLVEKPAGRRPAEIAPLADAARRAGVLVRVGFNHRYHPSMQKARKLIEAGELGPMMFVRARYGHGGRIGYDREWRSDPVQSGGGELIDQGPHLIDLSRWFLGADFTEVDGFAHTFYWDMPVDDNGFMLLKTAAKQVAFLHASCTEWKNLFSMEIYGRDAKLEISGLGGSYGLERLTFYKMLPQMGPPETTIWEYPFADQSWELEFAEFLEDIELQRQPSAGLADALAASEVIETIYRKSGL